MEHCHVRAYLTISLCNVNGSDCALHQLTDDNEIIVAELMMIQYTIKCTLLFVLLNNTLLERSTRNYVFFY